MDLERIKTKIPTRVSLYLQSNTETGSSQPWKNLIFIFLFVLEFSFQFLIQSFQI